MEKSRFATFFDVAVQFVEIKLIAHGSSNI